MHNLRCSMCHNSGPTEELNGVSFLMRTKLFMLVFFFNMTICMITNVRYVQDVKITQAFTVFVHALHSITGPLSSRTSQSGYTGYIVYWCAFSLSYFFYGFKLGMRLLLGVRRVKSGLDVIARLASRHDEWKHWVTVMT